MKISFLLLLRFLLVADKRRVMLFRPRTDSSTLYLIELSICSVCLREYSFINVLHKH